MGKLRVIKSGPLATIQDYGRYGFRKYGIPQSGAMDKASMIRANRMAGNPDHYAVIEFGISGLQLIAEEKTSIALQGASLSVNNERKTDRFCVVATGDEITISAPIDVYAYLAIAGKLKSKNDFGSFSTYLAGEFGGYGGRGLKAGDLLETIGKSKVSGLAINILDPDHTEVIRFMKGPESRMCESLDKKRYRISPASNRMGIRLEGSKLKAEMHEITSSAVIPGTIQLPPDGFPIVLMNDCQTTGGYPRIGKVLDEDLGKLAQVKPIKEIMFQAVF